MMSQSSLLCAAVAAAVIIFTLLPAMAQEEAPKPSEGPAAAEGETKPPAYPSPTASEEARIKELLALIPVPPALASEKRKLDQELGVADAGEDEGKAEGPEDPVEKQIEILNSRIAEIESRIKGISPNLHGLYRKKLDQALKDADASDEIGKKKIELMTIEKFMRDLTDSEAAAIQGIDDRDVKKIDEVRKAAIEDRNARLEAFYARYGQFMKKRREAMDELIKFESKAVTMTAAALADAGFDAGACLVEVLVSVKKDDRFHDAVLSWFGRQKFEDALTVPTLVQRVVALNLPGIVPVLASALDRTSFQLKATILSSFYKTSKANKDNIAPSVDALLGFLVKGDQANREICINSINRFMADAEVPKPVKVKVLSSFDKIAWMPNAGKMPRNIAYGLGMSGMEEAVDPLVRMLRHGDGMTVIYAVQGLGNLGKLASRAARDVLDLTSWGSDIRLQQSAILTLGKIGSYEPVDALIAFLDSENKAIKMTARDALRMILKQDFVFNTARWRSYWDMLQKKIAAGEVGE